MRGNSKIKVMLVGPYPRPGGMQGTYGRILNNITASPIFQDRIEFVRHRVTLPADGGFIKRFAIDMSRFICSMHDKPDIVHYIMQRFRALYREFPILKLAKAMGAKTAIDIRAGSLQRMLSCTGTNLQNAMMSNLLRRADAILVECRKDITFIQEQFGRKAIYVPNAMLKKEFDSVVPADLNIPPGSAIKIIYSGRYSSKKGIDVILRCLDILSDRKIRVEVHLTGGGDEPMVLDMIKAYEQSSPEGTKVIDHGWNISDLYGLQASCHVFVMPTCWPGEGHPNSVTEAMMCGLALILSDWTHRKDIVPEDGNIVIPSQDPVALADALESLTKNPSVLISAGRINRNHVHDNYLDTVCYPRILNLYDQLMTNRSQ